MRLRVQQSAQLKIESSRADLQTVSVPLETTEEVAGYRSMRVGAGSIAVGHVGTADGQQKGHRCQLGRSVFDSA